MSWLDASALDAAAVIFAPFAGVLLWALALRHLELQPDADAVRLRTLPDLVPMLGWTRHLRTPGAVGREATRRAVLELGALAIAIWALLGASSGQVWPTCGLGWLLLAAAVIDARERVLPDEINAAIASLGIFAAIPFGRAAVIDHAIGAAVGVLVFVVIAWVYMKLRGREGLGLGDAKLLGGLGAWVGWQGLASVAIVAGAAALAATAMTGLLRRRLPQGDDEIRLGPYLALGGWLIWLYGPLHFTVLAP